MQLSDPGRRPFALPTARRHYPRSPIFLIGHIRVEIEIDFHERTISGVCSTRLTPKQDGLRRIRFDAVGFKIFGVSLENSAEPLPYSYDGSHLDIDLGEDRGPEVELTVVVSYSTAPERGLYFIAPDDADPDKPVQVWSQGGNEEARYWFPCIDAPNHKATTELLVAVPEMFFALSNGELVETKEVGESLKVYHWRQDVPHSTYLVSLVVGEYVGTEKVVEGIPVQYYVPPGREADGERAFGRTPDMLRFFSDRIGVPYPFKKYAQITVTDFLFSGMENSSCTTLSEETLRDSRAHLDSSSDPLVAHELAHQWWGNLVTCRDWPHAWLHEALATYFEALWIEHDRGEEEFEVLLHTWTQEYLEECRRYRRPIVTNLYEDPIELFDRHMYKKGALVLHMLRGLLGDEDFFASLRDYCTTHQFRNVATSDLIRAIENVTGRNLEEFFEQWVGSAGHPEFEVSFQFDPEQNLGSLHIRQVQEETGGVPDVFRGSVDVEIVSKTEKISRSIDLESREQTVHFPLDGEPEMVRFDPHHRMLKTVSFSRASDRLSLQLRNDPHPRGRIEAAKELARAGGRSNLKTLQKALQEEKQWGVRAEIASALGEFRTSGALQALLGGLKDSHPKVRVAVLGALAHYREEASVDALCHHLASDRSYEVEAAAARSLGRTRSERAYDQLEAALEKSSFNEIVRVAVFDGLGELRDERLFDLAREWMQPGVPDAIRAAALVSLTRSVHRRDEVRDDALELLHDRSLKVRFAALETLARLEDPKAIPELMAYRERDLDGRLRRAAFDAIDRIRAGDPKRDRLEELRGEVDQLRRENANLRERLDRLETQTQPKTGGFGALD